MDQEPQNAISPQWRCGCPRRIPGKSPFLITLFRQAPMKPLSSPQKIEISFPLRVFRPHRIREAQAPTAPPDPEQTVFTSQVQGGSIASRIVPVIGTIRSFSTNHEPIIMPHGHPSCRSHRFIGLGVSMGKDQRLTREGKHCGLKWLVCRGKKAPWEIWIVSAHGDFVVDCLFLSSGARKGKGAHSLVPALLAWSPWFCRLKIALSFVLDLNSRCLNLSLLIPSTEEGPC